MKTLLRQERHRVDFGKSSVSGFDVTQLYARGLVDSHTNRYSLQSTPELGFGTTGSMHRALDGYGNGALPVEMLNGG